MSSFFGSLLSCVILSLLHFPVRAQDTLKVPSQADTSRADGQSRSGLLGPVDFNFLSWEDNMMGPSPEAARMTRYADTPVSYALGLYSPRTATWLSQDPIAESYYPFTPYLYCAGSPVNVVDPEGLHPIYALDGSFLGTDDEGLQGAPLFMDPNFFRQGMPFSEAKQYDVGFQGLNDENAVSLFMSSYCSLPPQTRLGWVPHIGRSKRMVQDR